MIIVKTLIFIDQASAKNNVIHQAFLQGCPQKMSTNPQIQNLISVVQFSCNWTQFTKIHIHRYWKGSKKLKAVNKEVLYI